MEMTKIETASGDRGNRSFPAQWGTPPGDPHSAERSAWVLSNVHNAPTQRPRSAVAALRKARELAGKRDARTALVKALSLSADAPRRSAHVALAEAYARGAADPGRSAEKRAAHPQTPAPSAPPAQIPTTRSWQEIPPHTPADIARGRAISNTFCDYVDDPADLAVRDALERSDPSFLA